MSKFKASIHQTFKFPALIYQMYTYLSWYHSHYYFFSFSFHHVLYENLYWYFWTNFQNLCYHILLWEFCSHLDVSFSLTFHPQCLEIVGILLHWISFLLPIESERVYLNLNCKILTVDNSIMITNELSLPVLVILRRFLSIKWKKNTKLVKKVSVTYLV